MNYVGIDVGLTGAIAIYNEGKVTYKKMPTYKVETGSYNNWYDIIELLNIFNNLKPYKAVIEYQRPMSKQGVTSMFRLGRGFGLLEGIIASTSEDYKIIDPKTWQSFFSKTYLSKEEKIYLKEKTKNIKFILNQIKLENFKIYLTNYSTKKTFSLSKFKTMFIYQKMCLENNNLEFLKDHNLIDSILIALFCAKN